MPPKKDKNARQTHQPDPTGSRLPSPPAPRRGRSGVPTSVGGARSTTPDGVSSRSLNSQGSYSSEHGLRLILDSIHRFLQRLVAWNPATLGEVTVKESRLEELRSSFASWQEKLHNSLDTLENAPALIDVLSPSIDACETQLEECHLTLIEHRFRLTPTNSTASSVAQPTDTKSSFKLERIKPPTFNGDFTQWESFRDLFSSAIHDNNTLSKSEKMFYLRNSLKGDALSPIANFPVTAASYDEAWDLVVKRYSNIREILFSHLRKFDTLSAADDSATGIRKITDNLNEMTRSLKSHKTPVEHWDVILVYWTLQKVHKETKRQWLLDQQGTEAPVLADLVEFLEHRARALSDSQEKKVTNKDGSSQRNNKKKTTVLAASTETPPPVTAQKRQPPQARFTCIACKETHFLFQCQVFAHLSLPAKIKLLNEKELCHNCFKKHPTTDCTSKFKCKTCQAPHHSLLHPLTQAPPARQTNQAQSSSSNTTAPPAPASHVSESQHAGASTTNALLETALVYAQRRDGSMKILRAFLDRGSEINFISESCSQELGIHPKGSSIKISGALGTDCGSTKGKVALTLHSTYSNFRLPASFEVVEKVTQGNLPRLLGKSDLPHIQGLQLADPLFYKPQAIDVLLGSVSISLIRKDGLVLGPKGTPNAEFTQFGWVLGGAIPAVQDLESSHVSCFQVNHDSSPAMDSPLEKTLLKFWEMEEPHVQKIPRSEEDALCEEFFLNTTYRQTDGRYVVRLPFKPKHPPLQDSLPMALRRFYSAERRCVNNPSLKVAYQKYFKDHLASGVMEVIPAEEISISPKCSYYMPYTHVLKESSSSTKLRVVYDCSAETQKGPSLNEILYTGTKLLVDLIPLLIRFRTYPFALSADIVKFFNQFGLHEDDRDFQRILYRDEPNHPIQHLRMCRLTFGGTPFPFLASRGLLQLFEDEEVSDRAKEVISEETLVDNVLTGAFSISDAISLQTELDSVMKKGKLDLTKWASNNPNALSSVPESSREVTEDLNISENVGLPTLGLRWNPAKDVFRIVIPPENLREGNPTKRSVLSQIARIYDPLGWISPVTIRPKLLLQKLWKNKLEWDTPLPSQLALVWKSISKDLQLLKEFSIPRCYNTSSFPPNNLEYCGIPLCEDGLVYDLFGFSDGSNVAYAAVTYLRTSNLQGDSIVSLIGAKTKVGPVKGDTTPRLELNGARLLARFLRTILDTLKIPIRSVTCYSDSTSVLGQLHPKSKELKDVYVRNRVRTIQELLPTTPWIHVSGCENPADCCSRGISTKDFLQHELYFQGPSWLKEVVPPSPTSYSKIDSFQVSKEPNAILEFIERCPSFFKMKRIIAQVIRAKSNFFKKSAVPKCTPISPMELENALLVIVRSTQEFSFPDEIQMLREDTDVRSNRIRSLAPFLDPNGVIRVGGRLSNSNLPPDSKYPILLPKDHHFTKALVHHYHIAHLHAGPGLLHSLLSEKFWILGGSGVAKKIVRSCITCWKARPRALEQKMADLPEARVNLDRPFLKTGMDFCGHFTLCITPGRNPRLTKSYICVFVCMATKAVHLELVGNLTTSAFIAALKRLVSRRGRPVALYSDCGLNFVGAKKELDRIVAFISSQEFNYQVTRYTSDEGIQFYFNTPLAPHHGGLWEAAVKSTKHHLTRVVGDRHLSYEEFSTLLTQIEALLNSRPLLPMSPDPNDFQALTPAHFLIGSSLLSVPEENLLDVNENRLDRWERSQRLHQEFRRRFQADYLKTLQSRIKWTKGVPNLPIGSLVLVKESENLLTNKWNLARITKTFPGKDGRVRVVEIRTPNGNVYRRPITKIAPLPNEE